MGELIELAGRLQAGLLDTSVVIDLEFLDPTVLPWRVAISSVTLAELTVGPLVATSSHDRARRQVGLQRAEAAFDPIPFDVAAARAFGPVWAAVLESGRQPRRRTADLQIAATALANGLPLVTRNAGDFAGLHQLITIISI